MEIAEKPELRTSQGNGTILVVDDETFNLIVIQEMLENLGHKVYKESNGAECLAVYGKYLQTIDLVLLDVYMPVMDGNETLNRLREIDPRCRVIFCSGFTDRTQPVIQNVPNVYGFLRKPFRNQELSRIIADVPDSGSPEDIPD